MTRILLVHPWNYHDEDVSKHDLCFEWRNGPYSLILLATQISKHGHEVELIDLERELLRVKGKVENCLTWFADSIRKFKPDIIGFGFFSVHYIEVQKAVKAARDASGSCGIKPIFIAGGIHASIETKGTLESLGFDYSFVGEADLGLLELAEGQEPETIQGVVGPNTAEWQNGETVRPLDTLPFPDWSYCDYKFYSHPSWARLGIKETSSLDMLMGRGCINKCAFCAYRVLSPVRYYTAEYLVDQIDFMISKFGIKGIYFHDSSIGNNWKLLEEFCETLIDRRIPEKIEWYGNIRADQVDEERLRLLRRAGCGFLFYGFESGSQRMLDRMAKGTTTEQNYQAAELHNKLLFPYNASMIIGYPGETEEDFLHTIKFIKDVTPLRVGLNHYVPLPGSRDYDEMIAEGKIDINDPLVWREIGEVNQGRIYADITEKRFQELVFTIQHLVQKEIPRSRSNPWKRFLSLKKQGTLMKRIKDKLFGS